MRLILEECVGEACTEALPKNVRSLSGQGTALSSPPLMERSPPYETAVRPRESKIPPYGFDRSPLKGYYIVKRK
ncbi:hypothetical protein [Laspinema palackyanum]|uniref:hypothetical protein n=1 Tax=Laspinema palackyanum TaxID=3231601 RepID=UPI00345CB36C|nr:hypothetical protein [Laspinema sp. D2c]